jgi:hypothetical protein
MNLTICVPELLAFIKCFSRSGEDVFDCSKAILSKISPYVATGARRIIVTIKVEYPKCIKMWMHSHMQCHSTIIWS